MSKYFKNISLRLFFILLGISTLLTAHAWLNQSPHIQYHIAATLILLISLAYWLARSINRIRHYAEAMAANHPAPQPQFGDSYLYRLVHAITQLRHELNHRQHIENYILGLTHELKTPLTAQAAALELLQDSPLTPEQHQLVARIIRNTQNQQQLIAKLLELARLENSDHLSTTQATPLAPLCQQILQDNQPIAQAKQLALQLNTTSNPVLQGDPMLLRQAINNLLANALDFATPHTTIHISLSPNALHIDNQGDPIPDYALAKIPQRFYSLPRANGRRSSGLGLNFVAEIMRLHGGKLVLQNQANGVRASLIFAPASKP
ncbi:Sensor protein CreC [Kingella potus]|uniref:histidine kinase n=1 Tax=Kingella potus TaxID=265175 RepID=A0A377R5B2_9NEIS|nr:histidine kinase dimerization/phospho-acceptor domain-containing protein [Kingella potus]UOO99914.1 ATP-binding protein [Kingella potus]STR03172.1 Sensor protein CreC [Kingella potus]